MFIRISNQQKPKGAVWKGKFVPEIVFMAEMVLAEQSRAQQASFFLKSAECLGLSSNPEFEIMQAAVANMQNDSPHVEKSADAFKHMSYETTQLGIF